MRAKQAVFSHISTSIKFRIAKDIIGDEGDSNMEKVEEKLT